MGCFAWFCCKRGGGVREVPAAFRTVPCWVPTLFQESDYMPKVLVFFMAAQGTFSNRWTWANIDAHAGFLLSGALLENTVPRGTFHADVSALKQRNRGCCCLDHCVTRKCPESCLHKSLIQEMRFFPFTFVLFGRLTGVAVLRTSIIGVVLEVIVACCGAKA